MALNAGLWIDHKKAVVVLISEKGEETIRIESDIQKPSRTLKGSRPKNSYTPNDFVAEDRLERRLMDHLHKYYDKVIDCVRDAETILILGPGEAKGEFKKRIKSKRLRGRIAELETADKMTDRQIVAKVRQHLLPSPQKKNKTKPSRTRLKKSR